MNNKINQTYLQIISQSDRWQDSLGGKLVTGIGSLFKGGAKAVGATASGIGKAANSSAAGIKKYVKEHKTKSKIINAINNIKTLYNPQNPTKDSVKKLIENKAQIKYILDSSKLVLPPNLLKFLQIFQSVGDDLTKLVKENPQIASRAPNEIKVLINQSLLQKVQSFKQNIESTITQEVQQDIIDIYYNLIVEKKSDSNKKVEIDLNAFVQQFNDEYSFEETQKVAQNIIRVKRQISNKDILDFLAEYNHQIDFNQNSKTHLYMDKIEILHDTLTIGIQFKQNNKNGYIYSNYYIQSKLTNIDDKPLRTKWQILINDGSPSGLIDSIASNMNRLYFRHHDSYSKLYKIAMQNNFQHHVLGYKKTFLNSDLKSILEKFPNDYLKIKDIISNDKLICYMKIKQSNLKFQMQSEYYKQPVVMTEKITDYNNLDKQFNNILDNVIKKFYLQENNNQASQKERKDNLNNIKKQQDLKDTANSIYNNMRGIENILLAGNDSIENDIKWKGGLFGIGSLKKVLREIATCKLDIADIKYLAKVFFQTSIIK